MNKIRIAWRNKATGESGYQAGSFSLDSEVMVLDWVDKMNEESTDRHHWIKTVDNTKQGGDNGLQ